MGLTPNPDLENPAFHFLRLFRQTHHGQALPITALKVRQDRFAGMVKEAGNDPSSLRREKQAMEKFE